MVTPKRRFLLDASALIGVVLGEPEFACLESLIDAIRRDEVTLVESTAMLVEARPRHRNDTPQQAAARKTVRALLESQTTELVDVSAPLARKAGELASELGMDTWDAVHLATAILSNVDHLIVRDGRFPPGKFEGVEVSGPFDIDEGKLKFDGE
ncbi:type II toxin-antitoxin system VapC family toxin [Calidifontibacter sp. DB0510]|uniref:Ribonuclease VapC n=1 Tax=Metallococcus carri TaxID=1656884 RepID=A0A967EHQ6_9MICO|nr:PIN domain-containing protein [Metallococcus carri]NHN56808.1 type II toxin-antitoxin system VapC family toxin [Metallococcus carri]NOP37815.1 PIN domain-containing protein [Calidifontibacter sp. DB2511S]